MPASRLLSPFIVPLLLAVPLACGGAGAAGTSGAGAFPLTLTNAAGKVTIPHRPSRILSLSATATEDLYAVGAGAQVVAVDSYSNYPAYAPKTSLSAFQPNVEAIAGYRPDLVLVSDDVNGIVGQLGKLQVPALLEPPAADFAGVYAQLAQIGQATGHAAEASTAVSNLKQQVQSTLRSVPATSRKLKVYHELDQTYFSATTHTFIGQVYRLLGLGNISDAAPGSNPYPQLSSEFVISANPDLIVLADTVCCGQSLATVSARPGWSAINAVRNGTVVAVDDSIASEWGPRIAVFMQTIANELKALRGRSA
jgi:iron complex transport system substrate-binding protein